MTKEMAIQNYIAKLGLTRKEATELWEADHEVDKMGMKEIQSDLNENQKKAIKNATKTTSKEEKTVQRKPRERKIDTEKEYLIAEMAKFLQKIVKNLEIRNKNNEICFTFGENEYSLKLTKHRKKADK